MHAGVLIVLEPETAKNLFLPGFKDATADIFLLVPDRHIHFGAEIPLILYFTLVEIRALPA